LLYEAYAVTNAFLMALFDIGWQRWLLNCLEIHPPLWLDRWKLPACGPLKPLAPATLHPSQDALLAVLAATWVCYSLRRQSLSVRLQLRYHMLLPRQRARKRPCLTNSVPNVPQRVPAARALQLSTRKGRHRKILVSMRVTQSTGLHLSTTRPT